MQSVFTNTKQWRRRLFASQALYVMRSQDVRPDDEEPERDLLEYLLFGRTF